MLKALGPDRHRLEMFEPSPREGAIYGSVLQPSSAKFDFFHFLPEPDEECPFRPPSQRVDECSGTTVRWRACRASTISSVPRGRARPIRAVPGCPKSRSLGRGTDRVPLSYTTRQASRATRFARIGFDQRGHEPQGSTDTRKSMLASPFARAPCSSGADTSIHVPTCPGALAVEAEGRSRHPGISAR